MRNFVSNLGRLAAEYRALGAQGMRLPGAALFVALFAGAILFAGATLHANAATIDLVLARFSSSTVEYPTLWQESSGTMYAADMQLNRFRLKPYAVTTNVTLTIESGNELRIGAIAGNTTIQLPSAVTAGEGYIIDLQDIGGALDATHALAINATAGNINGSSSKAYSTAYGGLRFISNGANWFCR